MKYAVEIGNSRAYKVYIPAVVINLDALYIIDKIQYNLDFTD